MQAINEIVNLNQKEIDKWLADKSSQMFFRGNITMDRDIGIVVNKRGSVTTTNNAKVILFKDNTELGYHIRTTFLEP